MKTNTAPRVDEQLDPQQLDLAALRDAVIEALHLIRVVVNKLARQMNSMDMGDLHEWVDRKVAELTARLGGGE